MIDRSISTKVYNCDVCTYEVMGLTWFVVSLTSHKSSSHKSQIFRCFLFKALMMMMIFLLSLYFVFFFTNSATEKYLKSLHICFDLENYLHITILFSFHGIYLRKRRLGISTLYNLLKEIVDYLRNKRLGIAYIYLLKETWLQKRNSGTSLRSIYILEIAKINDNSGWFQIII